MKKRIIIGMALSTLFLVTQCQKKSSESGGSNTQPLALIESGSVNRQLRPSKRDTRHEDQDPLELPVVEKISGEYMKAFLAAYEAFMADPLIPDGKRGIENYSVEFRQRGDLYYILFFAKRKPSERELSGGESELGKDVIFTIRKTDYQIVERFFFK